MNGINWIKEIWLKRTLEGNIIYSCICFGFLCRSVWFWKLIDLRCLGQRILVLISLNPVITPDWQLQPFWRCMLLSAEQEEQIMWQNNSQMFWIRTLPVQQITPSSSNLHPWLFFFSFLGFGLVSGAKCWILFFGASVARLAQCGQGW